MNKQMTLSEKRYCNDRLTCKNITITYQEYNDNLYCIVKQKRWVIPTKKYVRYLGSIRGQGHSPLLFSSKKDEFISDKSKYPSDFIEMVKDSLLKYLALGGRIEKGHANLSDFVAICGYAGENCE